MREDQMTLRAKYAVYFLINKYHDDFEAFNKTWVY